MTQLKNKIDFSLKNGAHFLAAFDADGTLWSKDAGYVLFEHQIKKNLISNLPESFETFLTRAKKKPYRDVLSYMARVNKGVPLRTLRQWVKESLSYHFIDRFAFREIKELISFLLGKKVEVYIVTASLKWSVEPLAEYFGISLNNIIGVSTKVKNGVLTERLNEPITWQEGKVKALLERTNQKRPFLVAGNSMNDLFLIGSATHIKIAVSSAGEDKVNFKSEQKLKKIGQEKGWKIFSFKTK